MSKQAIETCVRESVETYFNDMQDVEPRGMYDMMMAVMEKPLIEAVMLRARHNQSKAAQWLGLNRNTLRKKLIDYDLI
jgi:Fis family transcriptional regulator, factor for inversion stimulation protein